MNDTEISSENKYTILLIEDDEDIRECLRLAIKSEINANIIEARNVQSAIDKIKSTQAINCIISDYQLEDSNSLVILEFLEQTNNTIPFILCSGAHDIDSKFIKNGRIRAIIGKPFKTGELLRVVQSTLTGTITNSSSQPSQKYLPVSQKILQSLEFFHFDVFAKLSENKYVKLAKNGDKFSTEDFQKYINKGMKSFFIEYNHIPVLIDNYIKDVIVLKNAKSIDSNWALEITKDAHEIIYNLVIELNLSAEAVKLANSCSLLAIASVSHEPSLFEFTSNLKFSKNNFLSSHSILLAQFVCLIAAKLEIQSEITQFKLAFAAMIHDFSFLSDSAAIKELYAWLDNKIVTPGQPDTETIYHHPKKSVEILKRMKGHPTNIEEIIIAHHERPNGQGYPNQTTLDKLSTLQSIFIISHDLVNFIWLQEHQINLKAFIESRQSEYTQSIFKKFIDKCLVTTKST